MDWFENLSIVNSGPGRLRLNLPRLYRENAAAARIEATLARHARISAVHANPLTARVLIVFDPAIDAATLMDELALARPATKAPAHPAPASAERACGPLYGPWHLREADEALAFFDSSPERGLDDAEAAQRLKAGHNVLPQPKAASPVQILLNQFKSPPVILLGVSALISVLTGGIAEAAAIGAVLVLNGGIGFVTERRAEATIASLSELIDEFVPVLRAGKVRQADAATVVGGDILLLSPGVRVAADVRLLEAEGLALDESALTGESAPVAKDSAMLAQAVPLAERRNMAFRGTAVSMGAGKGLVVGTGHRTEVGAIQALTTSTERPRTPVQRQLETLGNRLVIVSGITCAGIFALGLLRGYNWLAILKTSMSLAIAAVPEGLPAAATTSLARGIRRMRDQDVLIRSLHSVENIGAIDTICLDKTGTLTQNIMSAVLVRTVSHALCADCRQTLTLDGAPTGARPALERLLQVCVLCNEAATNGHGPNGAATGSSTENALLELADQAGLDAQALRDKYRLLQARLRAEGRNYMRTVHALSGGEACLVSVKGSPAEVLDMCGDYLDQDGQPRALDANTRAAILEQNEGMAQRQLRVLGFASAFAAGPPAPGDAAGVLTWLGLVGMADPLRPGAADMIASFHRAGIRTVMITGDQAATAFEIGSALHLNDGGELNIVDALQLESAPPEQLQAVTEQAHIFARVSPSLKLQIVRLLQKSGKTIAMTGDGINDGPALRAADVGIAMGGGTDVALSVADVALKNDDLDTLLEAVRQGRTIADNIGKSLHFLLSSNLSEILVVLGGVVMGSGQPLTPLQLLWLNLLSDLLPAIALAAEPAGDDVMQQPPRPHDKPIVGKPELWRYAREGGWLAAGALGAYAYGAARYGRGPRAGTLAFNALVLGQLLHAILCRSDQHHAFIGKGLPPNRELTLAIGGSIALQVAANLVPGLRKLLGIVPMGVADVLATLAGAGVPLLANELAKRRYRAGPATAGAGA